MRPDLYVEPDLCHTCESCKARKACKIRAIVQIDPYDLPAVQAARCRGCFTCVRACPHGALVTRRRDSGIHK